MRKFLIGFAVVAVIGIFLYAHHRSHQLKPSLETVYAGNRQVTIWSSTAQIREAVATATFGEPLAVLTRFGDQIQVRTAAGITGWADASDLLPEEFWRKAQALDTRVMALPVEARGHTRVLSNLHIDAGRETARIRQLQKGVPVDMFEREALPVPGSPTSGTPTGASGAKDELKSGSVLDAKKEDWWLIRAHLPDQTTQAGWILARFINLDIPEPLPDYASSANMHIVAYFELNPALDEGGATKPQYLVVGAKGSEGQACDFNMMRIFTWGSQRQRYETAFVDSDVCGKLPVKLTKESSEDLSFAFQDFSGGAPKERIYHMHQTIVRRVGAALKSDGRHGPPTVRITARAAKRTTANHSKHHT